MISQKKRKRVKVKICGITNLNDALAAQEAGADALGFVFYSQSPRCIKPLAARKIIASLSKKIKKIGVFVNPSLAYAMRIAGHCGLDMLQFHGEESPSFCQNFPEYKVIKAFRIKNKESLESILEYKKVHYYLFDAFHKSAFGGTGRKFNWALLRCLQVKKPFFISGGLTTDDVTGAIIALHPDWVDVSSGVEISPGIKDKEKIRNFISKIRPSLCGKGRGRG